MAKVICKLPNASELINGVRFVTHKLGMISEEVEDEVAAAFAKIPGYVAATRSGKPVEDDPPAADPNPPVTPVTDPASAAPAA